MNFWQALVLGLVQGLTEFLPVSSSGHLVLVRSLMGVSGDYMLFDIMVHVGTLLAVFAAFFKDFIGLFKPPFKTIGLLLLASVPAAIVGLFLSDYIDGFFSTPKYLCFFFIATAVILLATEFFSKKYPCVERPLDDRIAPSVGLKGAIYMGLIQTAALLPGISRSGSTIFGGTLARSKRSDVAKFSFFMSMIVIAGSALVTLIGGAKDGTLGDVAWLNVIGGMVVSFASGFLAIKFMMKLIEKADYKWFSLYLGVVGILTFIFYFCLGW